MKSIYLDVLYFAEIRRVKQIDIKGEIVEFPENVFEVATGIANYGKVYYYADEGKVYDLFIDKKDDKRVLIRVELNFYIGKKYDKMGTVIGKLVELHEDTTPDVIAELKDEEVEPEETKPELVPEVVEEIEVVEEKKE